MAELVHRVELRLRVCSLAVAVAELTLEPAVMVAMANV